MAKPTKRGDNDNSVIERLRRLRDMILGRQPSLLTQIVADLAAARAEIAAVKAVADRAVEILAAMNAGRATQFGITGEPVPATPPIPTPPAAPTDNPK